MNTLITPHPSTVDMTPDERLECYVERRSNGRNIWTGGKLSLYDRLNYDNGLYCLPNGVIVSKGFAERMS